MQKKTQPHHQRATRQRAIILDELRKVVTHPTAEEIYLMVRRRLPRISLGTVYRNLDLLTEMGEICKIEFAGASRRFDGNTRPHQHVRCQTCGRVADVAISAPMPDTLRPTLPGFTITAARLEFDGLCDACVSSP